MYFHCMLLSVLLHDSDIFSPLMLILYNYTRFGYKCVPFEAKAWDESFGVVWYV